MRLLSPALAVVAICALTLAPTEAGAVDPASYVAPINYARFSSGMGVAAGDTFGGALVSVLGNEARYELSSIPTQYDVLNNGQGSYYNAFTHYNSYGYEQSVRPLSGFAYGTAALIATGAYDRTVSGFSEATAMSRVEMAIRGVALADRANYTGSNPSQGIGGNPGSGGSAAWEAAAWISQAAEAAFLVWVRLTPDTRTLVATMVTDEANALQNYTVPYWATRSGHINSPGDTKAEENAWNGHMLATAVAMMPTNPNASAWAAKASELQVSAYSRPSDAHSTAMVDGQQVQQWLHGYNTFQDGVVVNHSIIHPDYLVSATSQYNTVATLSLAGQLIPPSVAFNADVTYSALTSLQFTPGADTKYGTGGTIVAPGGTIFNRAPDGSYNWAPYYPEGTDWTSQVTDSYLTTDLMAEWLGLDAGKSFDAMGWAQARVDQLTVLQNRPGHSGNIYQPGDWNNNYHGTDEVIYESNARAWVMWWLMHQGEVSPIGQYWGAVSVPEPSSLVLALTGALGVAIAAVRRRIRYQADPPASPARSR